MFKLLTDSQFFKLYPNFLSFNKNDKDDPFYNDKSKALAYMYEIMNMYGVDSKYRQAFFFSQCSYYSKGFTKYEEILRYSMQQLLVLFKGKFSIEKAKEYSQNPEAIANYVYANIGGNGDEASGDGWKFRPRGMLKIAFRDNYKVLSCNLEEEEFIDSPDRAATFTGAIDSACQTWKRHCCDASADIQRLDINTRILQGNLTDFDRRQTELGRIMQLL